MSGNTFDVSKLTPLPVIPATRPVQTQPPLLLPTIQTPTLPVTPAPAPLRTNILTPLAPLPDMVLQTIKPVPKRARGVAVVRVHQQPARVQVPPPAIPLTQTTRLVPLPPIPGTVVSPAPVPRRMAPASPPRTLPVITSPLPQMPPTVVTPTAQPDLIRLPDIPAEPTARPIPPQPTMTTSPLTPNVPLTPVPVLNQGRVPRAGLQAMTTLPRIPTTIPTAAIPTTHPSPGIQRQFTQELQLAPLSPRSPRVTTTHTPTIITHPTQPVPTETCCICYDEEIPTPNLLGCQHPVCGECVAQLHAPECPMCKQFLEGPLVTDAILADIMNRQEQARLADMTANYLAGVYLEEHPDANPEEVYARYRN